MSIRQKNSFTGTYFERKAHPVAVDAVDFIVRAVGEVGGIKLQPPVEIFFNHHQHSGIIS